MAIKEPGPAPASESSAFDMRGLWRLGAWGSTAVVALTALAIVTQSESGAQRVRTVIMTMQGAHTAQAVAPLAAPVTTAAPASTPAPTPVTAAAASSQPSPVTTQLVIRTSELATETKRLSDAMRQLSTERERLSNRVASLERSFEDITGSIKAISSVPTVPVIATKPEPMTPATTPPLAPVFSSVVIDNAPKQIAAPATEPEPKNAIGGHFAVDIGGAANVEALRSQWRAVKTRHGPSLTGMSPLVAIRETKAGLSELRLIVGPITTSAAAATLCVALAVSRITCHPTAYEGQRLPPRQVAAPKPPQ